MNDSFGDFNATQTAGAASEQKGEGILPMLIKQIHLGSSGHQNSTMPDFSASQSNVLVNGLDAKQQAVFQAIKSNVSEEGIGRKELKGKFSHISDSELNNILEFMISEGHIYSSIDPDHFICTM